MPQLTPAQAEQVRASIGAKWDAEVVPLMAEYIKIPNQSPHFDPDYATNGLQEQAMNMLVEWARKQPIKGMTSELLEEKGKTPFFLVNIPAFSPDGAVAAAEGEKTLLMYGHMDKQPPMTPWSDGLGPYEPVLRDGKLYGRGGADDGYAICASLLTVLAMQEAGIAHGRVAVIVEACEESGSYELPAWVEKVRGKLGDVDLVVCLDSGAVTYERLWMTTSLRGVAIATLSVSTMDEAQHSGIAGGVCPDSFRIARSLLNRVEDAETGDVLVPEMHCEIPQQVKTAFEALTAEKMLADEYTGGFPVLPGVAFEKKNVTDLALRNFWSPSVTVTGADGLPSVTNAGNVVRTNTTLKLSCRTAPTVDAAKAGAALCKKLTENPPEGAKVEAKIVGASSGWAAPPLEPWLETAVNDATATFFAPVPKAGMIGQGGTIPFMGMLGEMFPTAQFVISGVLGPAANAHAPNEFLHVDFGKRINMCMVEVAAAHCNKNKKQ